MTSAPPVRSTRCFLTARWSNLAMLSYAVEQSVLQPLLPPGCELDLLEGKAFVSLVAFDFLDTRVLGVSWPTLRNFPEINLRVYVRHRGQRGVSFIREFVPSRLVAGVARLFYNEPYQGRPMRSSVTESAGGIVVSHKFEIDGRRQALTVSGSKPAVRPGENSVEHFFKEHSWGYGRSRRGELLRYRVEHEVWDVYPVVAHELQWEWARVYGPGWSLLEDRRPDHVLLAAGSGVRVLGKE